eukprot:845443-Ditylum_brightwellii.AAC.1
MVGIYCHSVLLCNVTSLKEKEDETVAQNMTETSDITAIFRASLKMTKHERKRVVSKRRITYYKNADFNKAIMTFCTSLTDVGLGATVGKMEEDKD